MKVAVHYRIDAHAYSRDLGRCRPACRACRLERERFEDEAAAIAAQPPDERSLPAGDASSLFPPPRRFEVVVASFFD